MLVLKPSRLQREATKLYYKTQALPKTMAIYTKFFTKKLFFKKIRKKQDIYSDRTAMMHIREIL